MSASQPNPASNEGGTVPGGRLPLRCVADMSGFINWAYRLDGRGVANLAPSVRALSFDHALLQFCADCDPVFRARAEIAGTCDFAAFVERLQAPPSVDFRVARP
ncbi:MAG: hypothetical protein R3C39_10680 [Dehalococcoidia bacterium]